MQILNVHHVTEYRYGQPVGFGPHRLMFRPRDSHDIRLVSTALTIDPPASIRWMHDVFGNSIAIADFTDRSDRLYFESAIQVEHYGDSREDFPVEDYARTLPFSYPVGEQPDLVRVRERHYVDPDHTVDRWVRDVTRAVSDRDTVDVLMAMTRAIARDFTYEWRVAFGTQTPAETLRLKAGSCRDFAVLMMEGARALGLAARFVSGYLYDPALDDAGPGVVGSGATHAWVAVYLPGAGWVEFDPTNGIAGGRNLIRVASARDPSQAVPLDGTYFGPPDAFQTMHVHVEVRAGS